VGTQGRSQRGPGPFLNRNVVTSFRLNFSGDRPKMHYFNNKFSQRPLTFDFGDLKLRVVAKFCFFKLIMTKSNFKKISYDVMAIMSPRNVIKKSYFSILGLPNQNFWLRQCGDRSITSGKRSIFKNNRNSDETTETLSCAVLNNLPQ